MTNHVKNNQNERQDWFTPAEAAKYLRVSRQTIYNYMDGGLLPYYELVSGGGRRIRRSDLDALLKPPSKEAPPSP